MLSCSHACQGEWSGLDGEETMMFPFKLIATHPIEPLALFKHQPGKIGNLHSEL
jgi:hypothetical protein